jgi:hypothetical protein
MVKLPMTRPKSFVECKSHYESSQTFRQIEKSLLHDVCAVAAKKKAIFSLPLHTHHAKGIFPAQEKSGIAYNSSLLLFLKNLPSR